jgi:uncharacterized RDD family membrane protein YckC
MPPTIQAHIDSRQIDQSTLAPWWRRVCAELIDLAIVTIVTVFLLLIVGEHPLWYTHHGQLATHNVAVRYVVVAMAALLYYPPVVRYTDGQTIGKRLLQIRVIRTDSRNMSLAFAALREVGIKFVLLDLITILPIVGAALSVLIVWADVLWPLWDRENRALHDMLVGTRVIRLAPAVSHNRHEVVGDVAS